jgi:hypothetical protein
MRYRCPYRPEEEGLWALPHGEFGLDVIALVGMLRYEELVALHLADQQRSGAVFRLGPLS